MVEAPGKHARRHAQERTSQLDAERANVQFGPEVLSKLKDLEHTVYGKKELDGDVRGLLEKWQRANLSI